MNTLITRSIFLLILLFALATRLDAQSTSIIIQPDIRVFSVLAALHEAGLEMESRSGNPVRSSIDEDLKATPAELKAKLQKFVQDHMEGKKPEDQFAKYVSLALLTDGPPDFKLSLEAKDLPPDALSVADFLSLVKEFYVAGKVEAIWSRHRAYYDQAVIDYRPQIDRIILLTDGYLRIVSGSFLDRRLTIIPDFLAGPNTFNSRSYRENYYLVFGPSEKLASDEFRHQYLHFLLDPYALRFTLPKEIRLELTKLIETAPGIDEQYRSDLQLMVTESLIRAVELRMNKVPEPKATQELDAAIRSGSVLARHFYKSLQTFEESPEGIRISYPKMVKEIVVDQVASDFSEARKTEVTVEQPPPREPTEAEMLLREANNSLGNSDLATAAEQFQKVLEVHDATNAEALYGLGIVASIQNRRDIAKDYFSRALRSPSSGKATKVWAHIYLGRIFDLEDNRQNALQQYQSAIDVGDNTRNAQEVAQQGLREPFSARRSSASP